MMVLAVTLHNIPGGHGRGRGVRRVSLGQRADHGGRARWLCPSASPFRTFPEGAIISLPLRAEGAGKGRAFMGGVLSGVVEPIGAVLTILAARLIVPALPYLLSFAAGAMLYVVVEELIPEMSQGDAFQYRNGVLRRRLQRHDDLGCGIGLKPLPFNEKACLRTGFFSWPYLETSSTIWSFFVQSG